MKALKPGQVCMINGVPYRAKKRTYDCDGCALNSPFTCPNLQYANQSTSPKLDCLEHNIILVND